jgi:zinc protease
MFRKSFLPLLFLTLLPILLLSPADGKAVEAHTLKNGLTVILVPEPKAPVVTLQLWYRVGSRNEVTGRTGLAHLLEHMMFKGTKKHGKGEFSRLIARAGGTENAFTGRDYTVYFENLTSGQLELALELEADRMQNLLLDAKEFDLEREVVKEERRLRTEDDPQSLVVEQLYATAFQVHPYHAPVIGWMTDLNRITRDDAWNFYKRYYVPNNATLVIAGDLEPAGTMKRVKRYFDPIQKGPDPVPAAFAEPEQRGERRFVLKKEAQLPFVFAGYPAPNWRSEDAYALEVLAAVLSGGKTSYLYRRLVYEQQLALGAGGGYDAQSADPELFYFYGVPRPGRSVEEMEKSLFSELDRFLAEGPTDREIQKAKNQIEAEFLLSQDSNYARAMRIGSAMTIGAGTDYLDRYVERLRRVTREDVLRVGKTTLDPDRRTVGILIPLVPAGDEQKETHAVHP